MGYGTLNIWVRNEECKVVDRPAHLHIYSCCGEPVIPPTWFHGGHTEIKVPPGCYIVTAGVVHGNRYTDKTMVVVCCDHTACVNLVLNRFEEKKALEGGPRAPIAPIAAGCALRILAPFLVHARQARIPFEEARAAAYVLLKAAGVEPRQAADALLEEMRDLKEHRETEKKALTAEDGRGIDLYAEAIEEFAKAAK